VSQQSVQVHTQRLQEQQYGSKKRSKKVSGTVFEEQKGVRNRFWVFREFE
jgi:hypothetical protein